MLVALGRQANVEELNLSVTGMIVTEKDTLAVNEHCLTATPHIYGVGDLIAPPVSPPLPWNKADVPYAMLWVSLRDSQPTSFRPGCALFQKWRQHRDIVSGHPSHPARS